MNEKSTNELSPVSLEIPPLSGESPEAYEAFITYYDMYDRKLETVSKDLDIHFSTIKAWSSKFRWRQRIKDHRARLIGTRSETEAQVLRKGAMARAEQDITELKERSIRLQQLKQHYDYLFAEYMANSTEKTRLSELTQLALAIDKLSAEPHVDPKHSLRSAAQYDADLTRVYGARAAEAAALRSSSLPSAENSPMPQAQAQQAAPVAPEAEPSPAPVDDFATDLTPTSEALKTKH